MTRTWRIYPVHVGDQEIVAAILAGDPAGLEAAYDQYASSLFAYCRSLLRDREDAEDVLQDTFVVAARKIDGLRDPTRLRPWLYAVARNECLRRLRGRSRTVELDQATDVSDDSVDIVGDLHQAELRELIRDAFDGLNEGEREVLDLSLRHEFDGADLGAALGVSANHAHALLSRARGQLEKALGALLVARTGSADCGELAELLVGWDGRLNTLLRKRIIRHIENCDICGRRRSLELRPAALLGLGPIILLPPELRTRVFQLVGDATPLAEAHRVRVARRAEPFDADTGFPIPLDRRRRRRAIYAVIALPLFLLLGTGAAALFRFLPADHSATIRVVPQPATPSTASPSPSPSAPSSILVTVSASPSASPSHTRTPTRGPSAPVVVRITTTMPAVRTTTPTSVRSPSPSPSRSPSPSPGVLTVSGSPVSMDGPRVLGSFWITAEGGTVDYTVSLPPDPAMYGNPTVSPESGVLANGATVTEDVEIGAWNSDSLTTFVLTVNPGDISVTVNW
jgi:RNA polymerase sigma factor (sigma-70 family)